MWNNIIGHQENINILKRMLNAGKTPHAFLFVGAEGIGKMEVAKVFAAGILCQVEGEPPCGKCATCIAMKKFAYPDLIFIEPDGASIKINQIRELQHAAGMTSHLGSYRICIIDKADSMTAEASNSLLKLLEEPPVEFAFILISAHPDKVLETIKSRCSILSFNPISYKVIGQALMMRGYNAELSTIAAKLSGGCMGIALNLLTSDILDDRVHAVEIIASLPGNMDYVWRKAEELEKLGQQQVLSIFKFMIYIFRDCTVLSFATNYNAIIFNQDILTKLQEINKSWSVERLRAAYNSVKEAEQALLSKANMRLTCEALLIKLKDIAQGGDEFANSSRYTV